MSHLSRPVSLGCAGLTACALCIAVGFVSSAARAQGGDAQGAASTAPAVSPSAPATAAAKPEPVDSLDTRGASMRAYQAALDKQKLAASAPLSLQRLRDDLGTIEEKISSGRRDEAIGDLVYIVESPRFDPFKGSDEGRAAVYWLGDALGRGGAYQPARGYLTSLLSSAPTDIWYRRAVHSLVDLALESDEPRLMLGDLKGVGADAPDEITGDVQYLTGRVAEREAKPDEALDAYTKVSEKSRFWAQATYLSGVIAVERKDYKKGEALFCKVADPKLTPKKAPLFGGTDFFQVRDLARLGLGRVAHEQYRLSTTRATTDYLVLHDSDNLPEALYEDRNHALYEAKDYDGARQSIDELKRLKVDNAYEDETYILDAYIDLATCRFPQADGKLNAFLLRYDPVRDAARRLTTDDNRHEEAGSTPCAPAAPIQRVPAFGVFVRGYGACARRPCTRRLYGYGRAAPPDGSPSSIISRARSLATRHGDLDQATELAGFAEGRPSAVQPKKRSWPDRSRQSRAHRRPNRRAQAAVARSRRRRAGQASERSRRAQKELEAATNPRSRGARRVASAGREVVGQKGEDLPGLLGQPIAERASALRHGMRSSKASSRGRSARARSGQRHPGSPRPAPVAFAAPRSTRSHRNRAGKKTLARDRSRSPLPGSAPPDHRRSSRRCRSPSRQALGVTTKNIGPSRVKTGPTNTSAAKI